MNISGPGQLKDTSIHEFHYQEHPPFKKRLNFKMKAGSDPSQLHLIIRFLVFRRASEWIPPYLSCPRMVQMGFRVFLLFQIAPSL